jgi:hypothetical protein
MMVEVADVSSTVDDVQMEWHSWRDVLRLGEESAAPESWCYLNGRYCLFIRPDGDESRLSGPQRRAIIAWLGRLACPTVALAPYGTFGDALLESCDTLVANEREAAMVLRNVQRSPIASLVFVQVMRSTALVPIEEGLRVESLAYSTLQDGPEFKRWRESEEDIPEAVDDNEPPVMVDREADSLLIWLNRPEARNALNIGMRNGLIEAFDLVSTDPAIRSAVVSGVGKCYSVGGDLSEFGQRPDPATAHVVRTVHSPVASLLRCAQRVEFRVHGACIGSGAELPAFGRRLIAKSNAYFQLPELRLGLIPGSGGCISLPRRIGRQRTALLVLTGRRLPAREAMEWGLVDEIVD